MRLATLRTASSLAILMLGGAAWAALPTQDALPQPPVAAVSAHVAPVSRYRSDTRAVKAGDTAGSLLRALHAPSAGAVLAGADGALDRLSIGDTLAMDWRDGDPTPWRLRLLHGTAGVTTVERGADGWIKHRMAIPYTIEDGVQELTVARGGSLWGAADQAGLDESQIGALARIYEYDVDFNTEIQPGARIRAVAEKLVADDGSVHYGDIRAAEFVNDGKTYTAIRHALQDGSVGWFAPSGEGRRRPFLRSPLAFSRVTSGFSKARFHPLLGIARPHHGVDFGAPTGTPVRAVADGVVDISGWVGGYGNHVQVDHDGPYATSYSHLSAILVKRGQRVRQGDVIGRVGSTGWSTGPHLHYQFMVNGGFVNPLTIKLPSTGTLPEEEKERFFAVRDAVLPMLRGIPAEGDALADADPAAGTVERP
jgi:murein DD-endopeptidase MepM/ murein hydrolase activator NlpD